MEHVCSQFQVSSLIGQASVSTLVPNFHTPNNVIIEPQYETSGQCYLSVLMTVTAIGYRTVHTRVMMCIESGGILKPLYMFLYVNIWPWY